MTVEPAIVLDRLSKHYGERAALRELTLTVGRGEVFGFLGANGAGKSTTIRLLLNWIRPSSGSARVLGYDCRTEAREVRRRTGFLPDDLNDYRTMTGRQVVEWFAQLRGGVDWAHVESLADRLRLDLTQLAGEFSSGNRQKVGVITAFMHKPDVLILDEPTVNLDPLAQQEVRLLVQQARDEGRTVFLSSHDLADVERMADRVAFLRGGELVEVADLASLRRRGVRRIDIEFAEEPPLYLMTGVPGVTMVRIVGRRVQVTVDGPLDPVLRAALGEGREVIDVLTRESRLEDSFLAHHDAERSGTDG